MNRREDIVRLLTGQPEHPGDGVVIYRCVEAGIFEKPGRWQGSGHPVDYTVGDVADIRMAAAFRDIVGTHHWMVEGARLAAAWRSVGRRPGVMVRTPSGSWTWHRDARGAAASIREAGIALAVVAP